MTNGILGIMPKRQRSRENIERGARLKIARIEAGYESGADAAADLDVDYSTYNNHEQGWRGITRKMARQYADFFRVNLDWLYENIGERRGAAMHRAAPDPLAGLPPEGRKEVLDYIEYIKTKYSV